MTLNLVLLNETLRLHDNPLLSVCEGPKVAVVVLDKNAYFGVQYGIARANLSRLQQQLAAISQLKSSLASHNIGLITLVGNIYDSISQLANKLNASTLYYAEPVGSNEHTALRKLASSLNLQQIDTNSLLAGTLRPDLSTLPDRFTPFRKQLEPLLKVSKPTSSVQQLTAWLTPAQTEPYNQAYIPLEQQFRSAIANTVASERHALDRVNNYIWHQQHILHYKQTRNQLMGDNYASFLSTPLALGTLSVRYLWQQIVAFEQQVQANDSTYWLKFELLWREFFRWQFRKYGRRWFSYTAISGAEDYTPPTLSAAQKADYHRWCAGETGIAFIDANMRLLNQTGLMSNRGRQNVASYLIHDLSIDWRLGAAYFEQRLLDYDCASNWGNWAYIAGTGNSSKRQFNVIKQAADYDLNGEFVVTMLPERNVTNHID